MKFYFKLAATNLKADRRLFVPFVITTSFLMAINLIMLNAYTSSDVLFRQFGQAAGKSLFSFGSMTTAIISVILIIYANNFLHKQRIRQLGLYKHHRLWQTGIKQNDGHGKAAAIADNLIVRRDFGNRAVTP